MKNDAHNRISHLLAAGLFALLALGSFWLSSPAQQNWRRFASLSALASLWALYSFLRAYLKSKNQDQDACASARQLDFPEGQAKLIDSGKLPNRFHPRLELRELEICHFYVPGQRILFVPLPDNLKIDPTRLAVRYSGGQFYYIVRPQEILLPAQADEKISGELIITSQRILFLAHENAFEVPLQSLKLLDCSAHLVDFQIKNKRYTVATEAACYAEKVLLLLLRPPGG